MEHKITDMIKKLHPDVVLTDEVRLVDDGVLASMDIVSLVTEIGVELGIRVPAFEILPDNFNSVKALAAMLERLDDV